MHSKLDNIKTIALEGQSFFDIALKGGSLDSIFDIDPNISITDNPEIGKEYAIKASNSPVANFYFNHQIEPATELTENDILISTPDLGIGSMIIGDSF